VEIFKGNKEEPTTKTRLPADAQITRNRFTKIPERITEINLFPSTVKEGTVPLTKENIDFTYKEFLKENKDLFNVEPNNLKLKTVKKIKNTWYVKYNQNYKGIPVYNATVSLDSSENGKINSYASNYQPNIDVSTEPRVPIEKAIEIAKATYDNKIAQALKGKDTALIIYPEETEEKIIYHLAWKFMLAGEQPDPEIEKYFILNAHTSTIIRSYTARFPGATVSGNVQGEIYPDVPTDTITNRPCRNQYVDITYAGQAVTNNSGNFSKSLPWYWVFLFSRRATFKLDGPFAKVQNRDGADYNETRNYSASSPCNLTWTATDRDHINLFYHMNMFHDWLKNQVNYSWNNAWDGTSKFNARVNYSFSNAYAGNPMQFGTNPFARSRDVICHECIHNVLYDLYGDYIGWPDSTSEAYAMDEGFSDYFSCSYTDDSRMGEGYTSTPRNLNNTRQYPGKASYSIEGHTGGMIIGGAAWDLRQRLITTLGTAGAKIADTLLFEAHQILSTSPRNYFFSDPHESNFLLALYKAADDNNNLKDGFPYFRDIQLAFHAHDLLQAILIDKDSFDFSTNLLGTLTGGDLYYYDGKFWANNQKQRGINDLGNIGDVDLATVTIPNSGYTRFGVAAVKDHTYASLAQEGETGGYIAFRVKAISTDKSQVTIRYLYRTLRFLIDPKLIQKIKLSTIKTTIGGDIKLAEGKFFANEEGQLGIIDLGDLKNKDITEIKIPTRGYIRDGMPIVEGHTYVSAYKINDKTTNVVFKVETKEETQVTLNILKET
jgi:hypothetical protein